MARSKKRPAAEETVAEPVRKAQKTEEDAEKLDVVQWRRAQKVFVSGESIEHVAPITSFASIPKFPRDALPVLAAKGIAAPTPIQAQTFGVMLAAKGGNLLASAPTGSGKTLAFALPLILDAVRLRTLLVESGRLRPRIVAIVVEPTRELAMQTLTVLQWLGKPFGVRSAILGGSDNSEEDNKETLSGAWILVSTPARLAHKIGDLRLKSLRRLVFDESDRLFDNTEGDERSFRSQLGAIYRHCRAVQPVRLRVALFSATFSYEVEQWCRENLQPLGVLCVGARNSSSSTVTQSLVFTGTEQGKLFALRQQLAASPSQARPALIFVQSKDRVRQLQHQLKESAPDLRVAVVSSERTDKQRDLALESALGGRCDLLISTELAGRGLDLPNVELVINFDLPLSVVAYIHRVGRTGRAGRPGRAVTFFTEADQQIVRPIATVIKQAGFPVPEYLFSAPKVHKSRRREMARRAPKRDAVGRAERWVGNEKQKLEKKKAQGGDDGVENDRERGKNKNKKQKKNQRKTGQKTATPA